MIIFLFFCFIFACTCLPVSTFTLSVCLSVPSFTLTLPFIFQSSLFHCMSVSFFHSLKPFNIVLLCVIFQIFLQLPPDIKWLFTPKPLPPQWGETKNVVQWIFKHQNILQEFFQNPIRPSYNLNCCKAQKTLALCNIAPKPLNPLSHIVTQLQTPSPLSALYHGKI